VNFIFNRLIFKRFFGWWAKYNYVLAAALDTGTALSGIIIFFTVVYPGAKFPDWWGNTVYLNTDDAKWGPVSGYASAGVFWAAEWDVALSSRYCCSVLLFLFFCSISTLPNVYTLEH